MQMKTYKTSEIARSIGIHPNTVRLYEELNLITKPERRANGYRVYTELHIEQFRFARMALKVEVLQNGIRKQAVQLIKTLAEQDYDQTIYHTNQLIQQLKNEQKNAEEAIAITQAILNMDLPNHSPLLLTRKKTAELLHISIDTLRNWEMNGLLTVKRKQNGYRVYTEADIRRLKMIRSLRCANYSLASILRMLNALSSNSDVDIRDIINTPKENEDIVSVCDKLLTSLQHAENNAEEMLPHIYRMKKQFTSIPTL